MLRGFLTLLTFAVSTTVLGLAAIVAGGLTGSTTVVFRLGRLWSRLHLRVMGIRPVYVGLAHADGAAPRVFLANHLSTLDIWVLTAALPVTTRFVAKRSIFWIPVLGQAMAVAGFIPIDRSDRASAIRSLSRAAETVRAGASIILFPEGTRSRDGRLGRFKRGAFHLAIDAGVPVVPVAISGTFDVVEPNSIIVRPGPVRVEFAPPIDVRPFAPDDYDGLMGRVRDEIASRLQPSGAVA
ncbi:MAG TPA: lysophospholipid acyltransferase family protein [Candidatus Polarisedimenticolaceae bacterium]|nr:lysophospholipid acyltransferase family protein [Candidatus Polarisedimenticolaceae bacterium]